ncbi:MAG: hypothetical protein RSA53_09295 [Odoribacter sp.]
MIKKIVIVSSCPLDSRINVLFALDKLVQSSLVVEYLNLSGITTNEHGNELNVPGVNTTSVTSFCSLNLFLKSQCIPETIFIMYMNYSYITYKSYKIFSKCHCRMGYFVNGCLPEIESVKVFEILKLVKKNLFFKKLIALLYFKSNLIRPFEFVLYSCQKAKKEKLKIDKHTYFGNINSTDYQKFNNFKIKKDENIIADKYAVFIDDYLPFHVDVKLIGEDNIPAEKYYDALNVFFDKVEREIGCQIVVAAHPIALKYLEHNYFKGRKVLFDKTGDLIKNCSLVIAHFSTAISFAVLFKKKMLLVTSDDINSNQRLCLGVKRFQEVLGCPLYNIDQIPDQIEIQAIDMFKYDSYKYNYVSNKESEMYDNAEIIRRLIEKL